MLAGIEALGGYRDPDASGPNANGQRFQAFVTDYFPAQYRQHAINLWDFRNGMVHGFSPRQFAITHHNPGVHLRPTSVLVPESASVRALWAPLSVETVDEAREALRKRERIREKNCQEHIGLWSSEEQKGSAPSSIPPWALSLQLHAVVWAALPPRFNGQDGRVPTAKEAVDYLRHLTHEQRRHAERYVRMAPRQVDTAYRRRFETEFGWIPLAER